MDTIRTERHLDQLKKRREELAMTLRHLGKERAEVEGNTEWISPDAYVKRAQLLSHVLGWYVEEMEQIDKALTQATPTDYALCAACGALIEQRHLEAAPESKFCNACQPYKDHEAEL